MTDGLGLRYSLIGPFETMQLNANGMLYRGEVGWGNPTKLDMGKPCSLCINFDRKMIINPFKYQSYELDE